MSYKSYWTKYASDTLMETGQGQQPQKMLQVSNMVSQDDMDMEAEDEIIQKVIHTVKTVEDAPDPELGFPCRPALQGVIYGDVFLDDLFTVPGPPVCPQRKVSFTTHCEVAQITRKGVKPMGVVSLKGTESMSPSETSEEMNVPRWPPVARRRRRRRHWHCAIS